MVDNDQVDALIGRWISDYRSRALWKKFDELGHIRQIDSVNYDIPAPVARQTEVVKSVGSKATASGLAFDDVELRSWLMVELMRRLSNGRDTATKSSAGAVGGPSRAAADIMYDRTALEEAVDFLDRIVEETNVSDIVTHADVSRLRLAMKRQSVYVCCRAGKYDLSASVFERQWTHWKNEREMDARREVSEVMAARNKNHPTLTEEPYGSLVNEGRAFLRKAFSALPVPFLVKAAHNVCDKIDKLCTTTSTADPTNKEIPATVVVIPKLPKKSNGRTPTPLQLPNSTGKARRGRPPKLFTPPARPVVEAVREIKTEQLDEDSVGDVEMDDGQEEQAMTTKKTLKKRKLDAAEIPEDGTVLMFFYFEKSLDSVRVQSLPVCSVVFFLKF